MKAFRSLWLILGLAGAIAVLFRALSFRTGPISAQLLLDELLHTQIQQGVPVNISNLIPPRRPVFAPPDRPSQPTNFDTSTVFPYTYPPSHNPHLTPLLRCPHKSNPHTNHIRIPTHHLNISLTTPGQPHDPKSRYFNPTLLPLPSWSRTYYATNYPDTQPPTYLLVNRVVTSGLHQESLICLASFCLPLSNTSTLPPDTHSCTAEDHERLGPRGGLRCISAPIKIQIPPTPALKCTGAWTHFPDIPGFHDPRIFWSSHGEPLIIVNSASTYGCVGLWIMDLRGLYPEFEEVVLKSKGRSGSDGRGSVVRFRHLTELGRWAGRAQVEKNWILWWPGRRGEGVVGYDLVGWWEEEEEGDVHEDDVSKGEDGSLMADVDSDAACALNHSESLAIATTKSSGNRSKEIDQELQRQEAPYAFSVLDETEPTKKPTTNNTNTSVRSTFPTGNLTSPTERSPSPPPPLRQRTGRTFAHLLSNRGHTTSNLTSPHEPPCFNPQHHFDPLGQRAHWHQSTNALKLILCTRAQVHNRACGAGDPDKWTEEGREVHFGVVHRKFSNAMRLPMRYERFAVVWEGRRPYRVLGVSEWPVAFGGEVVRPWSREENWVDEDEESNAYFAYTVSLAWAWRARGEVGGGYGGAEEEEEDEDVRHLQELGMGFLGDEVLVGVGLDDVEQVVVRVRVEDLVGCLRLCPGVGAAEEGKAMGEDGWEQEAHAGAD